jgi:hypothetical protein
MFSLVRFLFWIVQMLEIALAKKAHLIENQCKGQQISIMIIPPCTKES